MTGIGSLIYFIWRVSHKRKEWQIGIEYDIKDLNKRVERHSKNDDVQKADIVSLTKEIHKLSNKFDVFTARLEGAGIVHEVKKDS